MDKSKNLTLREFAQIHEVPRRTAALWVTEGKVPGAFRETTPFGDVWYIPREVSDNFDRDALPKKGRPKKQQELKAA